MKSFVGSNIRWSLLLGAFSCISAASAQVSVTTYHYDNFRSGANFHEPILTPGNVNSNSFGKLFSQKVDGQIYAQPLFMPGAAITGKGTHNVVFVATENDSVFAFDANSNKGKNAAPLWHAALADKTKSVEAVPSSDTDCGDINPQVGITGTPVIDPASGTLYVVAKTKEFSQGTAQYHQRLHALDVGSGAEKFGGPFDIDASVPGNCYPNQNGRVVFSALRQNQRAGLVLHNDILVVVWASHCDNNPYTGWAMAFQASTGKKLATFNDDPNMGTLSYECRGGIWQSGAAPAVDSGGNMSLATGNGYFDANSGGAGYGDSVLKLTLTKPAFTVTDYFTPSDQDTLDENDTDLGSGGVLLLPTQSGNNPNLAVSVGKEGSIYLLDRDNLGKYNSSGNSQIVQELPNAIAGVWGIPAYFNGAVYFGGQNDTLKAFNLSSGLFLPGPISQTPNVFGYPGTTPTVSGLGNANGIVWSLDVSAWSSGGPAVLYAFNAANLSQVLYSSAQNAARDQLGPAVKFATPVVANGQVYVGTGDSVAVFGIL